MNITSKKFLSICLISLITLGFMTPAQGVAAIPCKLSFTVSSDKTSVLSGENVTRQFTLKNIGKSICKDVSFSIYYGENETFVTSSPQARAANYYFYAGNLTSGTQYMAHVTTKPNGGSSLTTESCASATNASDVCIASSVVISGGATVPPIVTIPPVISPPTTTPPMGSTTVPVTAKKEQGIWIWNFPSDMMTATAQSQLKQLQGYGFNAVYITIDDYLDIASMPTGATKEQAKTTYFNKLASFVKYANSLGMQVDAEGGWKDWAKVENRWKGFALLDAAKEYNVRYPDAILRGFQYDVEPYLLAEYEGNKGPVLLDFVTFVDQSISRLQGSNVKLSLAIPHFYDDVNGWTPRITYGGKTVHTFTHLLSILDKQGAGGSIVLMSYRNTFDGTNGTRAVSETEIKEASAGYKTTVIVGQETGNVDPSYITFFGQTKTSILNAATTIDTAFKNYSNYGGVAIHYLDSFLEMR